MTSRAKQWNESDAAWVFSNLFLWLDFHRVLAASSSDGTERCQNGGDCAWRATLSSSRPPLLCQMCFIYRYTSFLFRFINKKVLVLTECADDIARCTGRAGSKGVRCSDGKLILRVWEKPFENHRLHLDLLSYYCPVAVKVWPWGSNKDQILNN